MSRLVNVDIELTKDKFIFKYRIGKKVNQSVSVNTTIEVSLDRKCNHNIEDILKRLSIIPV